MKPVAASPGQTPSRLAAARTAALAATSLLIALCLAWELGLAPTGNGTLAVKALPLLLPLPGLWRRRLRTYRWTTLLVWLYVAEGLVRATSDGGLSAALAAGEVALALAVFAACAAYVQAATGGRRPRTA